MSPPSMATTAAPRYVMHGNPPYRGIGIYDARLFENALTIGEDGNAVRMHARSMGVVDMSTSGRPVVEQADMERVRDSLLGRVPMRHAAILRSLHDATVGRNLHIDATGLAFLDSLGLHLPTMLLMGTLCDLSFPTTVDPLALIAADGGAQAWLQNDHSWWSGVHRLQVTSASLAPGVEWSDGGVDLDHGMLPDTMLAALPGMTLRDVVSHPLLDPLGLTIKLVADNLGWPRLVTDHVPRTVRVDRVAAAMIAHGDPYAPFREDGIAVTTPRAASADDDSSNAPFEEGIPETAT